MSVENPPTNHRWLRKWLSGEPHQIIGGTERPYMLRWYILPRNPVINVYLHKFMRSDDDRALHDHPWWFVSLMLKGEYEEITADGNTVAERHKLRKAGSLAFRPAEWRHRVQLLVDMEAYRPHDTPLPEKPCWTIIVTGRRSRSWGFWCPNWERLSPTMKKRDGERFVPWQEFGDAGCGETS